MFCKCFVLHLTTRSNTYKQGTERHLHVLKENSRRVYGEGKGREGDLGEGRRGGSDIHLWHHQSTRLSVRAAANCFSVHSRNIDQAINHVILAPTSKRQWHVVRTAETYCWTRCRLIIAKMRLPAPPWVAAAAVSVTMMVQQQQQQQQQ